MGGGCLGCSTIVYMSSGMFRGKESSNRIKLSQLVQELLNFGVFSFLQLLGVGGLGGWGWGWLGGWGGGGWGVPPTHMHMHMHACMHTHAHTCMVNMVISCKWPTPLMKSLGIPYDVKCACTHVHACTCVHVYVSGVHLLTTPQGGPPESFKIQ